MDHPLVVHIKDGFLVFELDLLDKLDLLTLKGSFTKEIAVQFETVLKIIVVFTFESFWNVHEIAMALVGLQVGNSIYMLTRNLVRKESQAIGISFSPCE